MALNARSKGASGERELAQWLYTKGLVIKPPDRNLEQVRRGGIDLIPEDHPFAYEVKRVEKFTELTLDKWWGKACVDARKQNREPVVAYRPNRSDWTFLISVESLLGVPGSYAIVKSRVFVKYAQKRIIGYGS